MHDFRYVTKKQAQPIKDELYQILYMVQDLVRDNFTFSFTPIGNLARTPLAFLRLKRLTLLILALFIAVILQ